MPAKQHSQSSPIWVKIGWIGCAIQQATSKRLPGFVFRFNILFFIYFFKYKTIETHARAFMPLNISAVGSVRPRLLFEFLPTSIKYLDLNARKMAQRHILEQSILFDLIFTTELSSLQRFEVRQYDKIESRCSRLQFEFLPTQN